MKLHLFQVIDSFIQQYDLKTDNLEYYVNQLILESKLEFVDSSYKGEISYDEMIKLFNHWDCSIENINYLIKLSILLPNSLSECSFLHSDLIEIEFEHIFPEILEMYYRWSLNHNLNYKYHQTLGDYINRRNSGLLVNFSKYKQ